MNKLPVIFLVIAAIAFVAGIVEGSRPGGWGIGIPLGAVCVGMAAIAKVMGQEYTRYAEEEKRSIQEVERQLGAK
jgi:hypothetical protein